MGERPNAGAILENAAFGILQRQGEVKFWRTKTKAEVDFVLESKEGAIPVEIKLGAKRPKAPTGLRSFIKTYKPLKAFVGTLAFWGRQKIGKTSVIFKPVWEFEKQPIR